MKILFLNPVGTIGGAERVLLGAIRGIRKSAPQIETQLITLSDGPLLKEARSMGCQSQVVPLPLKLAALGDSQSRTKRLHRIRSFARAFNALPSSFRYARQLRQHIVAAQPNLIHSNGIKTHLLARFAIPRRIPVVWHLHDIIGARPLAAKLLKHSRSRCAAAVAISQAVADDARIVLPCVPIAVVTNRIELTDFTPGESHGEQLDLQAGMSVPSENPTRIGLVATYARWKGQFVFLEAASRVLQDNLDFPIRWYVVGGPIYHTAAQFSRDELLTEIARLGLTGRVGLVPFAQQPAWIYRSLDIVVHASTQPEPFGLTIAEAMACGRPVIVSAAGGAKELFTDRVDAWGVSPGDVEELAHAMLKLAQTPELRDQLSQQARNTAESKFDSKEYAPELIKVYEQVLRHSISSK